MTRPRALNHPFTMRAARAAAQAESRALRHLYRRYGRLPRCAPRRWP